MTADDNKAAARIRTQAAATDWSMKGKTVLFRRALSLSPDNGITEDIGPPLEFEHLLWPGERPAAAAGADEPTSLPFHPLELAEAALCTLFYEGRCRDDDLDLERIVLAGFALQPTTAGQDHWPSATVHRPW